MSYYPTIEEDLKRAREILERGRDQTVAVDQDGFELTGVMAPAGTIYGADTYAAYKLIESFVAEIERLRQEAQQLATYVQTRITTLEATPAVNDAGRHAKWHTLDALRQIDARIKLPYTPIVGDAKIATRGDVKDVYAEGITVGQRLAGEAGALRRELRDIEAVLREALPSSTLLGDTLARAVVEQLARQKERAEGLIQQVLDQQGRAEKAEMRPEYAFETMQAKPNRFAALLQAVAAAYEGREVPADLAEHGLVQRALFYRAGVKVKP